MNINDCIIKRRSVRKFIQTKINRELLIKLVNAARFAPSASNLQPMKFLIVDEKEHVDKVFELVKWAGYIAPHGNPKKGEEPVAYIIILADTEIRKNGYEHDAGAAGQNIILTATEEGLGSCWIRSIDRKSMRDLFSIPDNLEIDTLIALGYPAEEPVAEDYQNSIKYYIDENGILHVPKRNLEDILYVNKIPACKNNL
ncbi:MAG: nitroreductase family protein [Ruminiclostridium sp.]|nr:nitroreductase family protein [Ruminiclostridium sp.]